MLTVSDFFLNLIKSDPTLAQYENDTGIQLLASSMEYKINSSVSMILSETNEIYNPLSEIILLSKMLYEMAYIRFKKPLEIKASLVSASDIILSKNTRFTDGESIFFTNESQSFVASVANDIYLTLKQTYNKSVTIENANLYYKIPLDITYKDLVEVNISINGTQLVYSQNFIDINSEYSYEIKIDGTMWVVVLLGNINANDLKLDDTLEVETVITPDIGTVPSGLGIIEDGYDIIISDIQIDKNYQPPMSIEEMKTYIRFGRSNIGDIVLNEDYRQLIIRNISDIDEIKVWQEKEEEKEVGADLTHINKVFVSYIHLNSLDINSEITSVIQDNIYGKEVVIKDAIIVELTTTIVLKTNTNVTPETILLAKRLLSGTYDDIVNPISDTIIYSKSFQYFSDIQDLELSITLSSKGLYKNRNFFRLQESNINVLVYAK